MPTEPRLIESATSRRFAVTRDWISRVTTLFHRLTFRIKRGNTPAETLEEVGKRWKIDDKSRQMLLQFTATKPGAAFIDEKVQAINRAAFHRSAFVFNALTQFLFVDLAAQLTLSLPTLKALAVLANLILALVAHLEMRKNFNALVAGPNKLPKRRRFLGLLANPKYNRAVKRSSKPYARAAWKEKSLYRLGYFVNAGTIFLGSQFIVPLERLIFPIGFITGKITGLFTTLVIIFDVWRGVRAGEDSRLAREREVAVYRNLNI
jgi:hypothetical protein